MSMVAAQDVRNNLFCTDDGRVYHTAAIGIIYDKVDHGQQL